MRLFVRASVIALFAVVLAACSNPVSDLIDPPVAKVGNSALRTSEANLRVDRLEVGMRKNPDVQQLPTRSELTSLVTEQYVVQHILMDISKEAGITASDAEIDAQVEEFRTAVKKSGTDELDVVIRDQLGFEGEKDQAFRDFCSYFIVQKKFAETLVTTDTVRAELTASLTEQSKSTELKALASHILVTSEVTATTVMTRLEAGEDFATLAKEFSQDPGSKENGGELGWAGKGQFVPEFEQAIFEDLAVGEVTKTPVKTQYGFHIIKLIDRSQQPLIDPANIESIVAEQLPSTLDQKRYDAVTAKIEEARTKGLETNTIVIAPTEVSATATPGAEGAPADAPTETPAP
jgi:parvulin-like peptidyl-prolyl isomerase